MSSVNGGLYFWRDNDLIKVDLGTLEERVICRLDPALPRKGKRDHIFGRLRYDNSDPQMPQDPGWITTPRRFPSRRRKSAAEIEAL